MQFWWIHAVKRSVFTKNVDWSSAYLAIIRYSQKSGYVGEFYIKFFLNCNSGLGCLLLNNAKNMLKRTLKSHQRVPLNKWINSIDVTGPWYTDKRWRRIFELIYFIFLCIDIHKPRVLYSEEVYFTKSNVFIYYRYFFTFTAYL